MKDLKEIRNKGRVQLEKDLEKVKEAILKDKVDLSLGKLKDTSKIKKEKRELARLLTVLKEEENMVKEGKSS